MRAWAIVVIVAVLTTSSFSQQTMPKPFGEAKSAKLAANASLEEVFQAKVKDEWEAIKNKDKKTYGDLLADDYEGVEVDGRGERNKTQAVNELGQTDIFNYTLWGFKLISTPPDSAFVIYEVTMQFPPRAQV